MVNLPTSSTSHFVNSHFVNSLFVNIDKMGIDEVGIDKVGTDKGGINHCEYAMLLFCSVCSHIFAMILPLFSTECQGPSVITK